MSAAARFVYDVGYMGNGALCGLAAITAGCSTVNPWAAIIIGGVAGTGYVVSSKVMVLLHMDDPLDAISVHAFGGTWGVFAVGEPPISPSSYSPAPCCPIAASIVVHSKIHVLIGNIGSAAFSRGICGQCLSQSLKLLWQPGGLQHAAMHAQKTQLACFLGSAKQLY